MDLRPKRLAAIALVICSARLAAAAPPAITVTHAGEVLRLAVIGDTGIQTATIAAALEAVPRPDAILLVGDNFYPCGVATIHDPKWAVVQPLVALGIPIIAILGNHDHCGNPDAQVNAPVPNWIMPAREYEVRSDVADIAVLDTTPIATGRRSASADATIDETFSHSPAPWRIAAGHHVIESSGFHGLFPRSEAANMQHLLDPLRRASVDLYICGHDHHEELLGGDPMFLVSGAGSDPVPMVRLRSNTIWPRGMHLRERIGFAMVEISREAIRIRFYDGNGIARSDPFTIHHRVTSAARTK